MAEVFGVFREMRFVDGAIVKILVRTYDTRDAADKASIEEQTGIKALMGMIVGMEQPGGIASMGKLGTALSTAVGIQGIGFRVVPLPVTGALMLPEAPRVTLK